jgi:hypothetical protein
MLAALAFVTLLFGSEPRRLTVPFATTVDEATVVCVGTVDAIQTVELPPAGSNPQPATAVFGHVKVERMLKGPADLREFWHEGWAAGFSEDMTVPGLNVRGLLLMGPPSMDHWASAELREHIRSELHTQLVLRNVGAGDGLIAIRNDGAGEYVERYTLPRALRAPQEAYPKGATRLADALAYIETLARFSGEALAVWAHSDAIGRDGASFDLRVLRDGSYRLASHVNDETVVLGRWEEPGWAKLRAVETQLLAGSSVQLESTKPWMATRTLRIALDKSQLVFSNAGLDPEHLDAETARAYKTALLCWAEIRAAITTPGLADHRARDRAWLDKH